LGSFEVLAVKPTVVGWSLSFWWISFWWCNFNAVSFAWNR